MTSRGKRRLDPHESIPLVLELASSAIGFACIQIENSSFERRIPFQTFGVVERGMHSLGACALLLAAMLAPSRMEER